MKATEARLTAALDRPPADLRLYLLYGPDEATAQAHAARLGRALGRDTVRRLAGSRVHGVSEGLARLGTLAVAAVRLVPVAPFTIVNLIAGAVRIRPRQYVAGTLLGMTPGIFLLTVFSDGLVWLSSRPTPGRLLVVAVLLIPSAAAVPAARRPRRS